MWKLQVLRKSEWVEGSARKWVLLWMHSTFGFQVVTSKTGTLISFWLQILVPRYVEQN